MTLGTTGDRPFTVFLVDDDHSVVRATSRLLTTRGYAVQTYLSGNDFLANHDPEIPGCAVFDVAMPGLDGLELQERLSANDDTRPVIFITGVGDVPSSVKAMKAGAVDFLTKPVRSADLVAAIEAARDRSEKVRTRRNETHAIEVRVASLTSREKDVLLRVIEGKMNKQIAFEFGIAVKTVKVHRSRMMQKMGVRSVAELVHLAEVAALSRDAAPGT